MKIISHEDTKMLRFGRRRQAIPAAGFTRRSMELVGLRPQNDIFVSSCETILREAAA